MDKLILLYFLLSGADIFSFKVFGNTIRIVNILALLLVFNLIILKKYQVNRQILKIYFPIIIIHFISIFYSISPMNSLVYLVYVIFYLFFTLNLVYSWGKSKSIDKIVNIYIISFRVISILTIIQFILGNTGILKILSYQVHRGIIRPALWFYEPSYLATFLTLYYMLTLILREKYFKDFILSILSICLTTSSTGYISIVVGVIIYLILSRNRLKDKIKILLLIIITSISILIGILIIKSNIIDVFIGRLFRSGISVSSGIRMKVNIQTLDVIKENLWTGIGTNTFEEYFGNSPMNITLEIFVTLGIIGGIVLLLFFVIITLKTYKNKSLVCQAFAISFLLFFIVLQANQNYMRLYMWNHIALMLLLLKKVRRKSEKKMAG